MACSCCPLGLGHPMVNMRSSDAPDDWLAAIKAHMYTTPNPEMHANLRGIFWMEGNAPEHIVTLEAADYYPKSRHAILRTYAPGAWATEAKKNTLGGHQNSCCIYDFKFDPDFKFGVIQPWVCMCCACPTGCLYFTMEQKEDPHVWNRQSTLCHACGPKCPCYGSGSYTLRRVAVRGEGGEWETTPHMAAMTEFLKDKGPVWAFDAAPASKKVAPEGQSMERIE